jgi:hypothetical protein
LIFGLTKSRALAPFTRRLGANTAGVGVCFLSERRWRALLAQAGLTVVEFEYWSGSLAVAWPKAQLLHIGDAGAGHFWCTRA